MEEPGDDEFWDAIDEKEADEAFEQALSSVNLIAASVQRLERLQGKGGVAASRRLRSNQIISLPPEIQDVVGRGEGDDLRILWHYVENVREPDLSGSDGYERPEGLREVLKDVVAFPVLSPDIISGEGINFVTTASVYAEKESGERDIRLSDQLPDEALEMFEVGDEVFFVEIRFPADVVPPMVWLLTGEQISSMFSLLLFMYSMEEADFEELG
ncbi:MAG: hypothetical protein SVU32_05260 [Candidatus Nanohaloarchaea archaeon]|nr:hypothetical protein [Candidatus Nanohaloarchaea archaeon]